MKKIMLLILLFIAINIQADKLRIFAVQSYNINNPCGEAQLNGFKNELFRYETTMITYYLDSRNPTKGVNSLLEEGKKVFKMIKAFNPDYVVSFDDNAFRYVIIPYVLPKSNYKILFSGLNKDAKTYFKDYNVCYEKEKNRIGGVNEIIDFEKLVYLLKDSNFIPTEICIFYDHSKTSKYFLNNVLNSLKSFIKNNNIVVHKHFVSTKVELRVELLKHQNKRDCILINCCVDLTDEMGKHFSILKISKLFDKYNKRLLEVFGVERASKFSCITVFVDFENMGKKIADMIFSGFRIENSKSLLWINLDRLEENNLEGIILKNSVVVDKIVGVGDEE